MTVISKIPYSMSLSLLSSLKVANIKNLNVMFEIILEFYYLKHLFCLYDMSRIHHGYELM